jgi:hypothetical protein
MMRFVRLRRLRRLRIGNDHDYDDFVLVQQYSVLVIRAGGHRVLPSRTDLRGAWAWILYGFGPTVLIPIIVVGIVIKISGKSPSLPEMGGRGDFAFMAVALAAGSYATVRKSAALKPGNRDDPNTLSGLTMIVLVISAAIWGYLAGTVDANQKYSTSFASSIGLVLLAVAAAVSISVAIADARLMTTVTLTVISEPPTKSNGASGL